MTEERCELIKEAQNLEATAARLRRLADARPPQRPRATASHWQWCSRPGCTKGAFKSAPACRTCSGWDPRLGDYPPGEFQTKDTSSR